jgi:hypothetical protein
MLDDHEAVGTLIFIDGKLTEPSFTNGRAADVHAVFDLIVHLNDEVDGLDDDRPDWTVSAWSSPDGIWYVVHHRGSGQTVRSRAPGDLCEALLHAFESVS